MDILVNLELEEEVLSTETERSLVTAITVTTRTSATTLKVEDPVERVVATSGAQETGIENPAREEPATLA